MTNFHYVGEVGASKSLMNRALILQSYDPHIEVWGISQSDDVQKMQKALALLSAKASMEFDCGEAGTTLRFLALRLSRIPGRWRIKGHPRLFQRPQSQLLETLKALDVKAEMGADFLMIDSQGWKIMEPLQVDSNQSSQFASAIILNAWDLNDDLHLHLSAARVSEAYMAMTLKLVQSFGLKITSRSLTHYVISPSGLPTAKAYKVEPDLSSAFALVACAIWGGHLELKNFPEDSWQPDAYFLQLLEQMGANFHLTEQTLTVDKTTAIQSLRCNLNSTPDLFPVLAVLLSRAEGDSEVRGIEHLIYKESDRLANTIKLLKLLGRSVTQKESAVVIHGRAEPFAVRADFDPDQDHRMAMAAQVACFGGADLNIKNKHVVNKSFPEFWKITEAACTH